VASGFGNLGGTGFGSALGPGFGSSKTGIYSFAPSGGSSGIIGGGSSSKPFGKSEDDGENEDEDDDAASAKVEDEANERDSRFYEQQSEQLPPIYVYLMLTGVQRKREKKQKKPCFLAERSFFTLRKNGRSEALAPSS
jgi:hypothetical protein